MFEGMEGMEYSRLKGGLGDILEQSREYRIAKQKKKQSREL